MFKKIFLLGVVLVIVPWVVASPDIFSLSKLVDSVTYPDNNTITISFIDPNSGILGFLQEIAGWTKTYENVKVSFSIQGNAVFIDNGEKQISKEYGTIKSTLTDYIKIAITENAPCKGEPIIVTATTTYHIVKEKETIIPRDPESQTISFEGRYCETVVCEQQLTQCKEDKERLFGDINKKDEDMKKLRLEKEEKIGELEINKNKLQLESEQYKSQLSECNSTLADSKGVVVKKEVIPKWVWVVIFVLGIICIYLYNEKKKLENKGYPSQSRF